MKPREPWLVYMPVLYPGRIGIWSVGFWGEPGENPRSKARANNKLSHHCSSELDLASYERLNCSQYLPVIATLPGINQSRHLQSLAT